MKTVIEFVLVVFILVYFAGCVGQEVDLELPPGVAYLQRSKGGHGFDEFILEGMRESEMFRRRLLAGGDDDLINTELLAMVLGRFCDEAPSYLAGRKGVEGFGLLEAEVRERIEGKGTLDAQDVYGKFTGKWYGKWDQMQVDHHWGKIVTYEQRRRIEIEGEDPVFLRSYQYCWVGDGYGINVIANDDGYSCDGDYLLGYVTHVLEGDMVRLGKKRPHVGIYVGEWKLIWITEGEVFLEESYVTAEGVDAYAITGFFYTVEDNVLETTGCFQANYTRDGDDRPEWFSFPLKLNVDTSKSQMED